MTAHARSISPGFMRATADEIHAHGVLRIVYRGVRASVTKGENNVRANVAFPACVEYVIVMCALFSLAALYTYSSNVQSKIAKQRAKRITRLPESA